jgi:hypothetical protein
MALASAIITTDAAYYLADSPQFVACNKFTSASKFDSDGAIAGDDDTDPLYPIQAISDGHNGSYSRPDAVAQVHYLICVFEAAATVDCLFVAMQSTGHATCTISAYLVTGGDSQQITNFDADYFDTHKRMYMPMLQTTGDTGTQQRQWTGVARLILKFDAGAGHECLPLVTEVIAGQQCQMPSPPLYPYGDSDKVSQVERGESKSGIVSLYKDWSGKQRLESKWLLASPTKVKALAVATDYFARPVLWVPNPYTLPGNSYIMVPESSDLKLPRPEVNRYEWEFLATEQGGSIVSAE